MKQLKSLLQRKFRQISLVRNWQVNREFHIEQALLNKKTIATTNQTSVIHYSVNKAATQYTKSIMLQCGEENGLLPVRMSDYAWVKEFPYLFTLSAEAVKPYLHIFRQHGYLYTTFGGMIEGISNIENYRTIVMIRDPRDVLVSAYYSYSKSHAIPQSPIKAIEFRKLRSKIIAQGIDDYVIEMSKNSQQSMQKYINLQRSYSSVCALRYEDMIADFPTWLDKLLTHCQWQISSVLRDQLINEAEQAERKKSEDTTSHRRQVVPGDHKRKLKNETIKYLNEYLAEELYKFGYQ